MVDMKSKNPVPFPEEVKQAWSQIDGVEPMIPQLETVCSYVARTPYLESPGKIKGDLTKLRNALRKLIQEVESIGYLTGCALAMQGSMSSEERLQYFGVTNKYELSESQGLSGFFRDVYFVEELASLAVEYQGPIRGRPRNIQARLLACLVKTVFDKHLLETKSYEDGAFFRVLDVAFSLVLPELGPEAYRRHADWAIKNIEELLEVPNSWSTLADAE